MKKFYIALCAVCAGMAFTACSNDDIADQKTGETSITTIFAGAPSTRTTLDATDGKTVNWKANDQIKLVGKHFGAWTSSTFTLLSGSEGSSAGNFGGSTMVDSDAPCYLFYPASCVAEPTTADAIAKITIPTTQNAMTAAEFEPIMMANYLSTGSTFKHLCTYVKLTIRDGFAGKFKDIELSFSNQWGDDDPEHLAVDNKKEKDHRVNIVGDFDCNADGTLSSTESADDGKQVKILPPDGSSSFGEGVYYIAIYPGNIHPVQVGGENACYAKVVVTLADNDAKMVVRSASTDWSGYKGFVINMLDTNMLPHN